MTWQNKREKKITLTFYDGQTEVRKNWQLFPPNYICINILRKWLYFVLYQCFSLEVYFVTVGTFILKGIASLRIETLKKNNNGNVCIYLVWGRNTYWRERTQWTFIMSILMIVSAFQCCTWKLIIAFGNIVVYYCMHHWVGMLYCTHFVKIN